MDRSEMLDEDAIGRDPLEEGMDPADGWSGSNRYGTTPREQGTDPSLNERLREERPDADPDAVDARPVSERPIEELDASVDDEPAPTDPAEPGHEVPVAPEVAGDVAPSGESRTRRAGALNAEPDRPAEDESVTVRPE